MKRKCKGFVELGVAFGVAMAAWLSAVIVDHASNVTAPPVVQCKAGGEDSTQVDHNGICER